MAKNNFNKIFECVAFFGLCCIAVVLIFQNIFKANGDVVNAFRLIGECIAYLITAISAFFYVRSKRNVWWYVSYTVAVVLIIVFVIL